MNATKNPTPQPTRSELKDLLVLARFTSVYCRAQHRDEPAARDDDELARLGISSSRFPLCGECRDFLAYAIRRRLRCPLDPKPTCKHCSVHCYRPGHREKVREIMRFSGRRLILRGRLDLLWHYFF
ncbi:MAG: hypothetical protein A2X84_11460 [Desulfuromonadaceae bacterium GWC2_58_13]|nr:MAG: hypothetical protein A2X84_11460 [Desulfuromonadaceae bacterium GWC2_58_13]